MVDNEPGYAVPCLRAIGAKLEQTGENENRDDAVE